MEMEFVIQKCTMSVIQKRKIVKLVGIELPDGKAIKSLVLEADRFLGEKMKLKDSKEYFRRLKKVLNSKLNCGNLTQGISTWA